MSTIQERWYGTAAESPNPSAELRADPETKVRSLVTITLAPPARSLEQRLYGGGTDRPLTIDDSWRPCAKGE
jgi:hypothetical protein